MAEPSPTSSAARGAPELPRGLACGFCGQPIQEEFFRAAERFCCGACAFQIDTIRQLHLFAAAPFAFAAGAGLLAAVGCGAAWAAIAVSTNTRWGFLAALIGYVVAKVVHLASGRRRGLFMQLLASVLAVVGILLGQLTLVGYATYQQLLEQTANPSVGDVIAPLLHALRFEPERIFRAYDVLWILLAVWFAWTTCRPLRIELAGPFPYRPAPLADGLHFDVANSVPTDSRPSAST